MIWLYSNRGLTYDELKDYEKALADYDKAIELNPEDATAYYNFACIKSIMGEIDIAFDYLKKAIERGQDKAWAWEDEDLDNLQIDERFEEIVGSKSND